MRRPSALPARSASGRCDEVSALATVIMGHARLRKVIVEKDAI